MNDADKVAQVIGALVGREKVLDKPRPVTLGETWLEIVWNTVPEGANPFTDDYDACSSYALVAHKTGVITAVLYDGGIPIGLKIE